MRFTRVAAAVCLLATSLPGGAAQATGQRSTVQLWLKGNEAAASAAQRLDLHSVGDGS